MADFWAKQAQDELKSGALSVIEVLMRAQVAAEGAGHLFSGGDKVFSELDDLADEVRELDEAIREGQDRAHVRNELGDVLFSVINICRKHSIGFDEAMQCMAERWLARKALQEDKIKQAGYTWRNVPDALNGQIWREVKVELKKAEYGNG